MIYLGENNSKEGIKESEAVSGQESPTHLNCFLGSRWGKEGGNKGSRFCLKLHRTRNTGKSRVMEANIF